MHLRILTLRFWRRHYQDALQYDGVVCVRIACCAITAGYNVLQKRLSLRNELQRATSKLLPTRTHGTSLAFHSMAS